MNHLKDLGFLAGLVMLCACLVLANKYQLPATAANKVVCSKCKQQLHPFDPIKQASPVNFISAGIFHFST